MPEISGLNKGTGHQRGDTYKRHGGRSTDEEKSGEERWGSLRWSGGSHVHQSGEQEAALLRGAQRALFVTSGV